MEEYEDELIEFFSREADNVKDKLCSKRTGKLPQHTQILRPVLTALGPDPHHTERVATALKTSDRCPTQPASISLGLGLGVISLVSSPNTFQNVCLCYPRFGRGSGGGWFATDKCIL